MDWKKVILSLEKSADEAGREMDRVGCGGYYPGLHATECILRRVAEALRVGMLDHNPQDPVSP